MERHWTSPAMAAALQAVINSPQSDRLKEALKIAPRLLDSYLASAVHDANDYSFNMCFDSSAYGQILLIFPDKMFSYEKPIVNRLGEAYDNPAKTDLALQLCWAIGEHGGGGGAHKDAARELFESLELLLYKNLSSSRLGLGEASHSSGSCGFEKQSSESRLLCFVVTAIATCHLSS